MEARTKVCPFCRQTTQETDRYCRQCGRNIEPWCPVVPVKQGLDTGMKFLIGVLGLLMAIGAFMVVMASLNGGLRSAPTGPAAPDEFSAYLMCEDFVKRSLKAPATAEFASYSDKKLTQVTQLDEDSFQVDSFVDAENSFGAKLRIAFVCKVTNTSGEYWRLDKLTTSED